MKLSIKRTTLIGLAFMSILAFWQMYDQVIPYILENTFHMSTLLANSIMSIDNILAIFMLPLFGALSDKIKSPLGKRTPYILFGTIIASTLLIFLGIFTNMQSLTPFLITLFLLLFTMSTYRTPAVAYMPDVTPKPLRSKANAIINLIGYIGGIFSTILMMFLLKSETLENGEKVYASGQSFLPVFVIVSLFMLFSVLILVTTVKENKLLKEVAHEMEDHQEIKEELSEKPKNKLSPDVFKSLVFVLVSVFFWFMAYNAVTTAFSRYCINILGADLGTSSGYLLTATIAAIAAFVPLGTVSERLGRKKTVLLGIVLMTVCYLIAIFLTNATPIIYVLFSVVGIGWAAINVNSYPMVVEMSSGSDVGKYTGFYYTFSMAAQITTPLLSGLLIDVLPFGYRTLFPYACICSVISFVTMIFVRHGDTKLQKKA
ncbi:MAG: MFS transporter [Clostridia bacterium]|nr:MFS transporter [Clostridia bacterium]